MPTINQLIRKGRKPIKAKSKAHQTYCLGSQKQIGLAVNMYISDYDDRYPVLELVVTAAGRKSFYYRSGSEGVSTRIRLGGFPETTVDMAWSLAKLKGAQVVMGNDPQDERRRQRAEMTLGELFKIYMDRHAVVHKKSWREDEYMYNRHLRSWSKKRLSVIKRNDIQKLHVGVTQNCGPVTANRLLALLHIVFAKGREWDLYAAINPVDGIKRNRERQRERFLSDDELKRFSAACDDEDPMIKDLFLMCLYTGARKNNVLKMRWSDLRLDLDPPLWSIPETKSGEPNLIPLTAESLEVIRRCRSRSKHSAWVFPGTGRLGHLVDPKRAFLRICKRAELSDLHIHDLRRTQGSWQAMLGSSLLVIGKSLGQTSANSTKIYARLGLQPVLRSMQQSNAAMRAAMIGNVNTETNDNFDQAS